MESRNPVLQRMEKESERNGGYAGFGATQTATIPNQEQTVQPGYGVPVGTPVATGAPMTITDVVVKTAAMFVPLLITAYLAWTLEVGIGVVIVAMLVATGLGLWGAISQKVRPTVYLLYAATEGVVLGGISLWYTQYVELNNPGAAPNIVGQAIFGTLAAFGAMLLLYTTRIIKVTAFFYKFMAIALTAYVGIAFISLISAFFGVGSGWGFYGTGGLGLLLCIAGVALASFTLVLDFDLIEKSVAAGVPEEQSWRAAFGLTVTLVWLYLEILRFLAILNSN
jgi:uncharacterized YccA/Bax inhibitor family protein